VVLVGCRAKFTENENLEKALIYQTDYRIDMGPQNAHFFAFKENEPIIYEDPEDSLLGTGRDGTGENILGKVLVIVREERRRDEELWH